MSDRHFHKVTRDAWGRLPGTIPGTNGYVLVRDYGYDVPAFNSAHAYNQGCRLGRTVGSDTTECDTHGAYVSHGVPIILRTSV